MSSDRKPNLQPVGGEGMHLTEQERQLLAAFRSMSADAKAFMVRTGKGIAQDCPAPTPRLALAYSSTRRAQ